MKVKLIIAHLTSVLKKHRSSEGFTLIELLVVIIIVGILSAIAIPSLLAQVGKAREAEAKETLSAIAQAQQAYFFEKATFAGTKAKLNMPMKAKYYDFPDPSVADANKVKHQAITQYANINNIRNYSLGVYQDSGKFSIVLCQSESVGGDAQAPDTSIENCRDGIKVE